MIDREPAAYLGFSLGQATDRSALVLVEPSTVEAERELRVTHLHSWPIGATYPTIAEDVMGLLRRPALKDAALVVDQMGVGQAVVDVLRKQIPELTAITITAGGQAGRDPDRPADRRVPKADLVAVVQVALQMGELKFAAALPDIDVLITELTQFRANVTLSAAEAVDVWRERERDDLVLALAVALWWERNQPPPVPVAAPVSILKPPGEGWRLDPRDLRQWSSRWTRW